MPILRAALVVFIVALASAAQTVELQDGAFRVSGWKPGLPLRAEELSSIFTVHTGGTGGVDTLAMLGTYSMEGDLLIFRPRFPLAPNVPYRAVFHAPGSTPIERIFKEKDEALPSARVERLYPSVRILPGNQLKLYVFFSAPMSRGEASKRIHWLDNEGKPLESPFLSSEELWDPEQTRLTVFFDPGRIKRGLDANELLGPPIQEGREYTLVIDREFLDARGVPMAEGFRMSFRGGPEERKRIDPRQWVIQPPRAGTADPLVVEFPKPMDYGLLESLLAVAGVAGTVRTGRDETQWIFTPDQRWRAGKYGLKVGLALEDLAGNRIDRLFDVDTAQQNQEAASQAAGFPVSNETISIPFEIPSR